MMKHHFHSVTETLGLMMHKKGKFTEEQLFPYNYRVGLLHQNCC